MKIDFINPFVKSVNATMTTMAGVSVEREKPFDKEGRDTSGDITGLIGFAENNIAGSVALSFPKSTIFEIFKSMTGADQYEEDNELNDIVGEFTNIVVGGAKKEFAEFGFSYNISLPMVVSGKGHRIKHKYNYPIIVVPF